MVPLVDCDEPSSSESGDQRRARADRLHVDREPEEMLGKRLATDR
jgi:hypothetical protein